jgi:hypothetical protein
MVRRALNLKEDHIEKLQFAQHMFEEGHQVCWDEAKILHVEHNSRYRKYKESVPMECLESTVSQPNLDFSFVWILLISKEINK